MNALAVDEMRYFADLDAREARDYAIERLADHVASDPDSLQLAITEHDEESALLRVLCSALSTIWREGQQATPEQSLILAAAVQGIADDAARRMWNAVNDD